VSFIQFIICAGVAALYVAANVLTQKSLEPGKAWLMGVVSVLAVAAFFAFRFICQRFGLAVSSGVVDSLLTILTLAIAVFVLKEELTVRQYCGLGVLLLGLYLVR
jgi:transporter family protein